jgi:hypothetical protein
MNKIDSTSIIDNDCFRIQEVKETMKKTRISGCIKGTILYIFTP